MRVLGVRRGVPPLGHDLAVLLLVVRDLRRAVATAPPRRVSAEDPRRRGVASVARAVRSRARTSTSRARSPRCETRPREKRRRGPRATTESSTRLPMLWNILSTFWSCGSTAASVSLTRACGRDRFSMIFAASDGWRPPPRRLSRRTDDWRPPHRRLSRRTDDWRPPPRRLSRRTDGWRPPPRRLSRRTDGWRPLEPTGETSARRPRVDRLELGEELGRHLLLRLLQRRDLLLLRVLLAPDVVRLGDLRSPRCAARTENRRTARSRRAAAAASNRPPPVRRPPARGRASALGESRARPEPPTARPRDRNDSAFELGNASRQRR